MDIASWIIANCRFAQAPKHWQDYISNQFEKGDKRLIILLVPGHPHTRGDADRAWGIADQALEDLPGFQISGVMTWDKLGATINLLGPAGSNPVWDEGEQSAAAQMFQ